MDSKENTGKCVRPEGVDKEIAATIEKIAGLEAGEPNDLATKMLTHKDFLKMLSTAIDMCASFWIQGALSDKASEQ